MEGRSERSLHICPTLRGSGGLAGLDKQTKTGTWQPPCSHLLSPGGISLEGLAVPAPPCMPGALLASGMRTNALRSLPEPALRLTQGHPGPSRPRCQADPRLPPGSRWGRGETVPRCLPRSGSVSPPITCGASCLVLNVDRLFQNDTPHPLPPPPALPK